jgi:hypothetical protein
LVCGVAKFFQTILFMLVDIAPKELSFVLTTWRKHLSYVILHILVRINILKLGPKIDKFL